MGLERGNFISTGSSTPYFQRRVKERNLDTRRKRTHTHRILCTRQLTRHPVDLFHGRDSGVVRLPGIASAGRRPYAHGCIIEQSEATASAKERARAGEEERVTDLRIPVMLMLGRTDVELIFASTLIYISPAKMRPAMPNQPLQVEYGRCQILPVGLLIGLWLLFLNTTSANTKCS